MGALIGALLAGAGAAGTAPSKDDLEPLALQKTNTRVQEQLGALAKPVRLLVFTSHGSDPRLNEAAVELAKGLAELSPQVKAELHDLDLQKDTATAHGVDKAPAIVVLGEKDCGLRFYGVPGGRELWSLVAAIKMASAGDSGLSDASRKALAGLKKPVHIEVFVTLSCAYCPQAVEMADRLAVESALVTADAVEASAFPELVKAKSVTGVPKVMVNGLPCFVGAKPEEEFVSAIVQAAAQ